MIQVWHASGHREVGDFESFGGRRGPESVGIGCHRCGTSLLVDSCDSIGFTMLVSAWNRGNRQHPNMLKWQPSIPVAFGSWLRVTASCIQLPHMRLRSRPATRALRESNRLKR